MIVFSRQTRPKFIIPYRMEKSQRYVLEASHPSLEVINRIKYMQIYNISEDQNTCRIKQTILSKGGDRFQLAFQTKGLPFLSQLTSCQQFGSRRFKKLLSPGLLLQLSKKGHSISGRLTRVSALEGAICRKGTNSAMDLRKTRLPNIESRKHYVL